MSRDRVTLRFDVGVAVEERDGYFSATTKPFAITVYGETEEEAEEKALKAVDLLLGKYSKQLDKMSEYLSRLGVKYVLTGEGVLKRHRPVVRECRRELCLQGETIGT